MITIVSTHFDDAVFSCWSVLTGDDDVTVLTVFTAGPDDDRTTEWDADTGVNSAARMIQRAAENDAALALAGRRATNLGLRESQYDGGAVDPELLRPYLLDAETVYVPSGTGAERVNPEHVVVRDACLELRDDAVLYADNPYWHFGPALSLPVTMGRERSIVELNADEREHKAAAIRCYAGELPKLENIYGPCADPSVLRYEVFWD